MAAAFVKHHSNGNAAAQSSTSLAPTTAIPVGNTAILAIYCQSNIDVTVKDTKNNSWRRDARVLITSAGSVHVFSSTLGTQLETTDTVHVRWNGEAVSINFTLEELSGCDETSYMTDASATATGTGTASSAGPTAALAETDDIVIGICGANTTGAASVGAGFTSIFSGGSANGAILTEYKVLTNDSTGQTATATWPASLNWGMIVVCYKSAQPELDLVTGRKTIHFSNSTTWTVPLDAGVVDVECWGAGAASGAGGTLGGGGGGGGGAFSKKLNVPVVPNAVETVTIGAQGDVAQEDGGDTWFKSTGTVLAKGGIGGTTGGAINAGAGGAGGADASGVGDTKFSGGAGAAGAGAAGGGGGGGAGTAAAGSAGAAQPSTAAGGADHGGRGGSGSGTSALPPSPGMGFGGGGGGGAILAVFEFGSKGHIVISYIPTRAAKVRVKSQAVQRSSVI